MSILRTATEVATLASSVASVAMVIRTRRDVSEVDRKVKTSNGRTIGQMVEDAEPHHHQPIPGLAAPEAATP